MKNFNYDHFPAGKWKKTLFFMKLTVVLLLCSVGTLAAMPTYSQDKNLDVSYSGTSLISVLDDLQSRTGYYFVYFDGVVPENVTVTTSLRNASLEEVLDAVLVGNGFTYRISESVIGIGKADGAQQQQPAAVTVRGVVSDTGGRPVVGASVMIKGTLRGTYTDAGGRFEISVPAGQNILQVSFVGMDTREVDVAGRTEITVTLVESQIAIEDVVVTGIFTKARESYTGAALEISKEELRKAGNSNLLQSIANIDPSFNVVQDLEYGSDPNRLPEITMRGSTSMNVNVRDLQEGTGVLNTANLPLFVLDGFEISLQRVMDMDQEMVESITLLKDASATAMYGARGANGIVVITSTRPEQGKLRISYRGDLTVEAPDLTSYNMMNAREKLEYEKAAGLFYSTIDDSFQNLQELYNSRLTEVERGVDTYWLKYPVRTGIGHRHSLTMDGGADNFRYSARLGYNNVAGVMKKSSRETMTGNIFFQYELKNVKFQNDLIVMFNWNYNSPYGSFSEYASANPIYTPYDDEGKLKKIIGMPYSPNGNIPPMTGNPLYNATLPYRDDGRYVNLQDNFAVEWYIMPELFLRGRLGITWQDNRNDLYLSRDHTNFETDYYSGDNYKLRGSYTYGTGYSFALESDVTLNWNKTFNGLHQIYAGLSLSAGENKDETYSITAMGFSAINMANLGMAGQYAPDSKPNSTEARSRRMGAAFNVNYTYDRRYFVDFSGKIEGSSKFGANDRTAPFWSVGVGWNMHHESFIGNIEAIDNLRLRFSYGTSGSQEFSAYQALTTYRYFQNESYKFWNGSYMIALGNPDLTWQKTKQANLGLDAALFDGRVNFNVDFYDKLTESLLTDINLPTASGFESYKANVGEVRNRGVELSANVFILRNMDGFTWSLGANLVHNRNKILKISNSLEFLNQELLEEASFNPSFLYKEGESMKTIYAVRSLGIDPADGREIFITRDGLRTYTWDAQDQVACGVDDPKLRGALRTMLRWRNLSMNAIFSFRMGGDVYNSTLAGKVENITTSGSGVNNPWNNVDRRALYDRWQRPGDHSYFKNIAISDYSASYASSRFVMRENLLQLSSVNLTYEFDSGWLDKNIGFVKYLNVSLHADDVFHLSTIKRERGTTYPFARQFSFSLSTRF